MTLIDTNVVLDLVTDDPLWADWSQSELEAASLRGPLMVNDIVYAEIAVGFGRMEDVDQFVEGTGLQLMPMSRAALFLAGKAFAQYRRAGGTKTGVLPDFFIGAQAAVLGLALLTRDAGRYRTYFPDVTLITPRSPN